MTREDAITEMRRMKKAYCNTHTDAQLKKDSKIIDALDISIKALKQELCGDCISREEMWKAYHKMIDSGNTVDVYDAIKNLPPVTPAIKKGKWIISEVRGQKVPCCSICGLGNGTLYEYTYCPNCGCKMQEVE